MSTTAVEIIYPESDGKLMADNTEQWDWIDLIKNGFEVVFLDDPNVFVAGDLLWYPVEGEPNTRQAPDVLVALGRPKGKRGSYQQWNEGGVAPQLVVEILSPGNRHGEMARKFDFYERYGVEEYYLYDPAHQDFTAWHRDSQTDRLRPVDDHTEVISPRTGVRFVATGNAPLQIFYPSGEPFTAIPALVRAKRQTDAENERLKAKLRDLGIDPDL